MNKKFYLYIFVFICLFFVTSNKVEAMWGRCVYDSGRTNQKRIIVLSQNDSSLEVFHSYRGNVIEITPLWKVISDKGYEQDVINNMIETNGYYGVPSCPKYAYYIPELYHEEERDGMLDTHFYEDVVYFSNYSGERFEGAQSINEIPLLRNCGLLEYEVNDRYKRLKDIEEQWNKKTIDISKYRTSVNAIEKEDIAWDAKYGEYFSYLGSNTCHFPEKIINNYYDYKTLLSKLVFDVVQISCPTFEENVNKELDSMIDALNYINKKVSDGHYSKEQEGYFKELERREVEFNNLITAYRSKCTLTSSLEKKISRIEKTLNTLKNINPNFRAPACEYLGEETIKLIQETFNIIKLLVPALLILLGSFDMGRAVLAGGEEDIKKAQKSLMQRLLASIGIFLMPPILNLILNLAGLTGGTCTIG